MSKDKISKTQLNTKIHLSQGNIKSKCTDDTVFLTWSLPSQKTCPYATALCKKKCFAKKNETFKTVMASRESNLDETQKETFINDMITHLEYHLQRPSIKNKKVFVRIHTSGDFYNLDYFKKWIIIADHFADNNNILFQAYTKSMPIILDFLREESKDDNIETMKQILKNINIHLVWSIWHDTPKEYNTWAYKLEMQTFTALPKQEIEEEVNKGSFLCNGDCGNCKECYVGKSLQIVIPYH